MITSEVLKHLENGGKICVKKMPRVHADSYVYYKDGKLFNFNGFIDVRFYEEMLCHNIWVKYIGKENDTLPCGVKKDCCLFNEKTDLDHSDKIRIENEFEKYRKGTNTDASPYNLINFLCYTGQFVWVDPRNTGIYV